LGSICQRLDRSEGDCPDGLDEPGDGVGPFGAKGVGEPSLNSIAPAIANAVYNAVGVRIRDLPLTPEKVLKAIQQKEKGN